MTDLTLIKKQRNEHYQNYYGQLEGYTIKKFEGMADDQDYGEDGFATFILEKSGLLWWNLWKKSEYVINREEKKRNVEILLKKVIFHF